MTEPTRSMPGTVNLRGTKENLPPQGTGSNSRPSARQRLPSVKLATIRMYNIIMITEGNN